MNREVEHVGPRPDGLYYVGPDNYSVVHPYGQQTYQSGSGSGSSGGSSNQNGGGNQNSSSNRSGNQSGNNRGGDNRGGDNQSYMTQQQQQQHRRDDNRQNGQRREHYRDAYPNTYANRYNNGSTQYGHGYGYSEQGFNGSYQEQPYPHNGDGQQHNKKESKMTDTVLPVAPIGYGFGAGFGGGYGYGGGNNCLADVVLANQISAVAADTVAAVTNSSRDVITNVGLHGLRNSDATNTVGMNLAKGQCDIRQEVALEGCKTRSDIADLKSFLSLQHCEIKETLLRGRIEDRDVRLAELQNQLTALQTQQTIQGAIAAAVAQFTSP